MNIEKEMFKKSHFEPDKLLAFGLKKIQNDYIYEKLFLDNNFKAIIIINNDIITSAKVYDIENNKEYLPLKIG